MPLNSATIVPTLNNGVPGSGNPPSLLIGKSLFVSSVGVNATAVRQDLKFHYLTLQPAITASLAGDTIFVYPGSYSVTTSINKAINLVLFPGAIVTGVGVPIVNLSTGIQVIIMGMGALNVSGATSVFSLSHASASLHVDCDSITGSTSNANYTIDIQAGSFYCRTLHQINANLSLAALSIRGAGSVNISCNGGFIDNSVSNASRALSSQTLVSVLNYTGPGIYIDSPFYKGWQAGETLEITSVANTSPVEIKGRKVNLWTGARSYNSCAILLTNTGSNEFSGNIKLEGDIQVYGTTCGIVSVIDPNVGAAEIIGNVFAESGHCIINASSGYAIKHIGNCYQSNGATTDAAVRIGSDSYTNGVKGGIYKHQGTITGNSTAVAPLVIQLSTGGFGGKVVLANSILIDAGAFGASVAKGGAAAEIYYIYQAIANVAVGAGVTNAVAPTMLVVDAGVNY